MGSSDGRQNRSEDGNSVNVTHLAQTVSEFVFNQGPVLGIVEASTDGLNGRGTAEILEGEKSAESIGQRR